MNHENTDIPDTLPIPCRWGGVGLFSLNHTVIPTVLKGRGDTPPHYRHLEKNSGL
jgi:hypothetical protein